MKTTRTIEKMYNMVTLGVDERQQLVVCPVLNKERTAWPP